MHMPIQPAGEDDPVFQLSMMGLVAKELGMVAMLWEMQDECLYLSGAAQDLGLLRPCMTLDEFRNLVHPEDVAQLDQSLAQCLAGEALPIMSGPVRFTAGPQTWYRLDCRFGLIGRDDDGQPARLAGMLMPYGGRAPQRLDH